jgi:hypothetical protein
MTLIEQLVAELAGRPEFECQIENEWLTVKPSKDRGYEVRLYETETEYIVFYENYHEHFKNRDRALDFFRKGLTEDYRVKVYKRNGKAYRWKIQHREDEQWLISFSSVYTELNWRFWRRREIEYLYNAWRTS